MIIDLIVNLHCFEYSCAAGWTLFILNFAHTIIAYSVMVARLHYIVDIHIVLGAAFAFTISKLPHFHLSLFILQLWIGNSLKLKHSNSLLLTMFRLFIFDTLSRRISTLFPFNFKQVLKVIDLLLIVEYHMVKDYILIHQGDLLHLRFFHRIPNWDPFLHIFSAEWAWFVLKPNDTISTYTIMFAREKYIVDVDIVCETDFALTNTKFLDLNNSFLILNIKDILKLSDFTINRISHFLNLLNWRNCTLG